MPTLRQLQYLVALADAAGFRRAAEVAHVSQPTLSAQIRVLERRLGVRLVERGRSRVLLTPAGQEIVARARVVLRDVRDIVDLAERSRFPDMPVDRQEAIENADLGFQFWRTDYPGSFRCDAAFQLSDR